MRPARPSVQPFDGSTILIVSRQRTKKMHLLLLKQITQALLAEMKIDNAELGISLVGAKAMAALNWKFLRHEGATDVITFSYAEAASGLRPPQFKLHGELFVCVDEAVLQAKKFGTSWPAEIVRYIVHGVLHLAGHDDLQPALRRKMQRAENLLLRRLAKKFSLAQIGGGSKLRA